MASQLFKIGFKKRNSAGEHYQISLSKGFRENVAGNGPAQVTVKQRCLDRNGLFVHVGTRRMAFEGILVNQIREEKNWQYYFCSAFNHSGKKRCQYRNLQYYIRQKVAL